MTQLPIHLLREGSPPVFPSPEQALAEPNGLLALGGDLSPQRLLAAYRQGIFPWYGEDEPLLWWSPDPRCVFDTGHVHVSRSLQRQVRSSTWTLTVDNAFADVMHACAEPREGQRGTWIVPEMQAAYAELHRLGHAHSLEIWDGERMVGGIYGVAVGRLFCGESMFSRESGGSKIALLALCRRLHAHGFPLLDAQVPNRHLLSLGAGQIPRREFLRRIAVLVRSEPDTSPWIPTGPEDVSTLID